MKFNRLKFTAFDSKKVDFVLFNLLETKNFFKYNLYNSKTLKIKKIM